VTTPTVIETRRAGQTNERVELARYTVSAGERVICGQRVLGVVRFLPGNSVVLVVSSRGSEDSRCRPRYALPGAARANASRHKRPKRIGDHSQQRERS
jgi:hypothetical protein